MASGLASGIACGVEEPKVDVGLLVNIGTTIIRETGLDDQIRSLFEALQIFVRFDHFNETLY